jgi:hypothetical protein
VRSACVSRLAPVVILTLGVPGLAQVPEITSPVTTAFATYTPVVVRVLPSAKQFVVAPDLGNVDNASKFTLTASQREMLAAHGFFQSVGRQSLFSEPVWGGDAYPNFEDVYTDAHLAHVPMFITTDTMLHAFHRLFDHSLMRTEVLYLEPTLRAMTGSLLSRIAAIHDTSSDPAVVEAARIIGTYLAVGARLLDDSAVVPTWAEDKANAELALVKGHQGRQVTPLFGAWKEDYSLYLPRGHYTRSEGLKRYFTAMVWFGRMTFALREYWAEDLHFPPTGKQRPDLTAAGILLLRELDRVDSGSAPAQAWAKIWVPTVFFVGESDDLGPVDYRPLVQSVYGAAAAELSPSQICNPDSLQVFMDRAEKELPKPRIRSLAPPGLRLFGQRFVPDSWYFSELTFPAVDTHPTTRSGRIPSVLDVMSALGSDEAAMLQRMAGEEEYPRYREQLAMLRQDVSSGSAERWASTLYWNWLYALEPLLRCWSDGFPPFMRDPLWSRRQLATAAGSWTELRHDTILYAKQSTGGPTGMPPDEPVIQAFVEPNPWAFARLAALAGYARQGLSGLSILDSKVGDSLAELQRMSLLLSETAILELERRPVPSSTFLQLTGFSYWLGNILQVTETPAGHGTDPNDRAPVVADVHTDADSMMALEEGTGYPGRVFVVADVEGRLQLCVGAVFVPYEFLWPASDRLTDEKWWEILASEPPALPWWLAAAFDSTSHVASDVRQIYPTAAEPMKTEVTLTKDRVTVGEDLEVSCTTGTSLVELRSGSTVVARVALPKPATKVKIPTWQLAPGELTVIVHMEAYRVGPFSHARRATLEPIPRTRRRLGAGEQRGQDAGPPALIPVVHPS